MQHYDPLDNLIAMQDSQTDARFDYDALSRLTAANDDSYHLQWQYDPNGNRLQEVELLEGRHEAYTIDTTSNRLLAVAGQTHQHDPNGNLIHDGTHRYQYNGQNRLIAVNNGDTARYRYNALGQRVYKWTASGNTANPDFTGDGQVTEADLHVLQQYIREGNMKADLNGDGRLNGQDIACLATLIGESKNQGRGRQNSQNRSDCLASTSAETRLFAYDEWRMLGEYHTDGNAIQETIWLGSLPVAVVQNGNVYHIHADHLGTPRVITDQANSEVWRWDSDPFGMAAANDDPEGDGNSFTFNLRFPGQYFDQESGQYYNWHRYYDPQTGRYITSDPIGLEGGLNTYLYANASPIRYVDYSGLIAWKGEVHYRSLIGGVGAGYLTFTLNTGCINGEKTEVEIIAVGPGIGVGFDVAESYANITFEDYLDEINPLVFNGMFGAISAGMVVGNYGGQAGKIRLGRAFQVGGSRLRGLDIGVSLVIGTSTVTDIRWGRCDCGK